MPRMRPKGLIRSNIQRITVAPDLPALADALSRLSYLVSDHRDVIAEIDIINPLFVRPAGEGVVAADALVMLRGR